MKTGVYFKPVLFKKVPNYPGSLPRRFERAANTLARNIEKDLKEPTKKWKHRVKFTRVVKLGWPKSVGLRVYTEDAPYGYMDKGTKKHFVAPKKKKALHWKVGRRKFFSKGHMVRGIKAHNWTKDAKKTHQKEMKALGQEIMTYLAKKGIE